MPGMPTRPLIEETLTIAPRPPPPTPRAGRGGGGAPPPPPPPEAVCRAGYPAFSAARMPGRAFHSSSSQYFQECVPLAGKS